MIERRYTDARALAAGHPDPLAAALVDWFVAREPESGLTAEQVIALMETHRGWPEPERLRLRAQQAFHAVGPDDDAVLAFYSATEPTTIGGKLALAGALKAAGRRQESVAIVRTLWREEKLAPNQAGALLARFGGVLTRDDHVYRFRRLVLQSRTADAVAQAKFVGAGYDDLARAVTAVIDRRSDAERLLNATAARFSTDPLYVFAKAWLLRRSDRPVEAARLILRTEPDAKLAGDGERLVGRAARPVAHAARSRRGRARLQDRGGKPGDRRGGTGRGGVPCRLVCAALPRRREARGAAFPRPARARHPAAHGVARRLLAGPHPRSGGRCRSRPRRFRRGGEVREHVLRTARPREARHGHDRHGAGARAVRSGPAAIRRPRQRQGDPAPRRRRSRRTRSALLPRHRGDGRRARRDRASDRLGASHRPVARRHSGGGHRGAARHERRLAALALHRRARRPVPPRARGSGAGLCHRAPGERLQSPGDEPRRRARADAAHAGHGARHRRESPAALLRAAPDQRSRSTTPRSARTISASCSTGSTAPMC